MDFQGLLEMSKKVNEEKKKVKKMTGNKFLVTRLNDYLWNLNFLDTEEQVDRYAIKGFHPSQLYDVDCVRKLIFMYFGLEQVEGEWEILPGLRRIFDNGSYVHLRLQTYFTDMNILKGTWRCRNCDALIGVHSIDKQRFKDRKDIVYSDVPLEKPTVCPICKKESNFRYLEWRVYSNKYWIIGKTDGVLELGGKKALLEIKSINTFQFKKLNVPSDRYLFQLFLYQYVTGITRGVFLYEDKNTQKIKEFWVSKDSEEFYYYDEEREKLVKGTLSFTFDKVRETLDLCYEAKKYIQNKSLPKGYDKSLEKCRKCSFREVCSKIKTYKDLEKLL